MTDITHHHRLAPRQLMNRSATKNQVFSSLPQRPCAISVTVHEPMELKSEFGKAISSFMTNDPMALSGRSAYLGLQHALASMGGIITAPLINALGIGLNEAQTAYVIAAALVVSGLATIIQIVRVGPIGSGLLISKRTSSCLRQHSHLCVSSVDRDAGSRTGTRHAIRFDDRVFRAHDGFGLFVITRAVSSRQM